MWGGATSNSRYKHMIDKWKNYWSNGDQRSIKAKRNIALSFGNKIIAIFISLAIVPITIDYLNPEQYGIWLTLSSIVAWISFFDIGLGHGFRNRFAEAKANGDIELARRYVSTTYFSMVVIFGIVLLVFELVNPFVNWSTLLNVSQEQRDLLSTVMSVILIGVCTQFAANVFPIMLNADQKNAASSIIATIGQACALLVIFIFTKMPSHSMIYIAFALTWIPVVTTLLISLWMFTHSYKEYSPSFKYVDKALIRNIINLGAKFFLIQASMIVIFQIINIVLSRELGPSSVTEYNVAYKYMSIPQMIFNIIMAPFWSAYTDAYTKGDYDWMKRVSMKLVRIFYAIIGLYLFFLLVYPLVIKVWINGAVEVSNTVAVGVFLYLCSMSYSQLFMLLLNGLGKVYIQMLVYMVFAIICIPTSILLCRNFGVIGIMLFYSIVYFTQALLAKKQLSLLLNKKASGIWDR